jgi:hypothetical protein
MTNEWRIIFILPAIAMIASCSARAVYYDEEKALARKSVERFHEYYNRNDYDSLYSLFSVEMRMAQPKDTVLPAMKTTFGTWGKSEGSAVVIEKVYLNRTTHDWYSTARVSKRLNDHSAACLRARY